MRAFPGRPAGPSRGRESGEPRRLSGGLPFVGHTVEFLRSPTNLLTRAHLELGDVAAFRVVGRRMVAVFGPDWHEAVLRAPDIQLSPSEAYRIMTPVFGRGVLYDAAPDRMAEQFKMLLPALRERRMRNYADAVILETEQAVAGWDDSGVIELVDFCRTLTNFTSSRCLLGAEFRETMSQEFATVYRDLERGVTPLAYVNPHLPVPSFIRRDRARRRLVEMMTATIRGRLRERREGEDFLQTLMSSCYSDGSAVTEDEITGLLLAGMFAGHHTSSATTAWTLTELLQNPGCLRRVTGEIDEVVDHGPLTYSSLGRLGLTGAAIKEALRLHPPLPLLVRVVQEELVFKERRVPKGSWVVISPAVAHRMPEIFPDPERFDPDRFLPPREEDKRPYAFIGFGGGRHSCLGSAFAMLQIKVILCCLLGRYELELVGDPIAADVHGLVVGPRAPCRVAYRRRARPRPVQ